MPPESVLSKIRYRLFFASISAFMCVTLLAGCGGDPNMANVSGTITLDGEPLKDAFVTFKPTNTEGKVVSSYGKTASDGTYQMAVSNSVDGAWIGENVVRIKTGDYLADGSGKIKEVVPAIYNTKTELRKKVNSGDNIFDFDLKSKTKK